jgi:penicillin-binding protein 1A
MKFLPKIFKYFFYLSLVAVAVVGTAAFFLYQHLAPQLPDIEILKDVRLQVPLRVYSADRKLIAEFGEKRRMPLAYDQIPQRVREAFLAAEDDRFFDHPGVDYQGLVRAATQLILTGQRRQGGSTITMQVARNFFLSREKTYTRKLKEILLALRIESELTKGEILELYLNKIYLGNRAYGLGAAAQVYYGRDVSELDLAQIAMLAALPKAPSTTNPIANPERALQRRNYVLQRMRRLGFASDAEVAQAQAAPITAKLHRAAVELEAPYVAEMGRSEAVERYGEEAYTRGLDLYTTVDSRLQEAANMALRGALHRYDRRHGFRGAAGHRDLAGQDTPERMLEWVQALPPVAGLERALVLAVEKRSVRMLLPDGATGEIGWNGLSWGLPYVSVDRRGAPPKRAADVLSPGDLVYLRREQDEEGQGYWRLAQVPSVEGALVSLDPSNGAIRALVGGYDFTRSKFNRAVQAQRQPGSGFKAFIYSAALEAGFTPASLINDAPLVVEDAAIDEVWRPENYSGKWYGPTRLRVALYKSRNLVSIRLLRAMGVNFALQHARNFGFDEQRLPRNLTLALGSGEVTPLQMARAYAVLANGGFLVEPYLVERIQEGRNGVLYQAAPAVVCPDCDGSLQAPQGTAQGPSPAGAEEGPVPVAPRTISAQNQYLMTSMMKDVIQRGTATRARSLGRSDIAGKTGTTNEQRDAWFSGFSRDHVAVVWVGFDSFEPLGRKEVGGRVALPGWVDYMEVALAGVPEANWPLPEGVVTVRIDPATGRKAPAGAEGAIFEVFKKEQVPDEIASSVASRVSGSKPGDSEALTQELF